MRASCNGSRVLCKGCADDYTICACLAWMRSPYAQANTTIFLAKFYGRAGLINLLAAAHDDAHHLALFRALPSGPPAGRLIDDILVEIISRVPAKALYLCKCVSKYWLGLIHHPDHRKRLPQTLAGFFYGSSASTTGQRRLELPFRYTSLSGDRHSAPFGASFTFLPNHHLPVDLLDSCNGLLLCRCYHVSHGVGAFRYIVCNPATDKWAVLPNSSKDSNEVATTSLGFDPAMQAAAKGHESETGRRKQLATQNGTNESQQRRVTVNPKSSSNKFTPKEDVVTGFPMDPLVVDNGHARRVPLMNAGRSSSTLGRSSGTDPNAQRFYTSQIAAAEMSNPSTATGQRGNTPAVDTKGETCLIFRVPGGQDHDFGQADGFVQHVLFKVPGGRFDYFGLAHGLIQRSQGSLHFANFQRDQDGVAIRLGKVIFYLGGAKPLSYVR
ncbi:putative serine/threonine-protein kinase [Hordeum vulgare]|nr:putative serine/threonine-protein kinase [Hordeum vulgare]